MVALSTASLLLPVALAAGDPKVVDSCNDRPGDIGATVARDSPTNAGVSAPVQDVAFQAYEAKRRP